MKNNKIVIRLEEEKDYREVENLVRDSFSQTDKLNAAL